VHSKGHKTDGDGRDGIVENEIFGWKMYITKHGELEFDSAKSGTQGHKIG
jgi:hypothetical protein